MIRAAERWRAIRVTDFERRQMAAVRAELHHEYEARTGLAPRPSADADQTKLSSTSRTSPLNSPLKSVHQRWLGAMAWVRAVPCALLRRLCRPRLTRPSRAIAERFEALLLVAVEDFVAGLSGYPERPANRAPALVLQQTGNEP